MTKKKLVDEEPDSFPHARLGGICRDTFDAQGERVAVGARYEIFFRTLGDQSYEVRYGNIVLGEVYRLESAWSYAPWVIKGDRKHFAKGGVNNSQNKRLGYPTRAAAAKELATIKSSAVVAELERQPPVDIDEI